jgi:diguanylate cyclase (GGDEF)-like protein
MRIGPAAAVQTEPTTPRTRTKGSAPGPVAASPTDSMTLMGVPEAELTPTVFAALTALMSEVDALKRERERLRSALRAAEEQADTDALTPLQNRRAFVRELARIAAFSERYDVRASLLFFDLDGFKAVNDQFGHAAGDAVLRHVAALLLANVRDSDVVGRVGGDEFAVILAKADLDAARAKGAALASLIAETPCAFEGRRHAVSASIGVHCFARGENAEHILARADEDMYAAKAERRLTASRAPA